jgi:hypothetical protein
VAGVLLGLVSEPFALRSTRSRSSPSSSRSVGCAGRASRPGPWQGGFWTSWVEGYRFVAGFAPARAMLDSRRGARVDDQSVFVADARYAKDVLGGGPQTLGSCLRRRAVRRARLDALSRATHDDPRAGPRDRDCRRHERLALAASRTSRFVRLRPC